MSQADDLADVSDNIIIKLNKAGGASLYVRVIKVLGAGVKSLEVLLTEVHHHHLLVESLHGKTEVEVVDAPVLLEILEEGVDELGILQQGREVHVKTGGLGLIVIPDKPKQSPGT